MIPDVCQAIVQAYKHDVFNQPVTPESLDVLAGQFEQIWNIPPTLLWAWMENTLLLRNQQQKGTLYFN